MIVRERQLGRGSPAPAKVAVAGNGDGSVIISWNAVRGATDHSVLVADSDGTLLENFQLFNSTPGFAISSAEYGFQDGTYYYLVDACVSD